MFNWISKCWGGMGASTNYQKARINCTIANWTTPSNDDISIMIASLKGENPELSQQEALNTFLKHLQQDNQKSLNAFILKHLLILDISVQQRIQLSKIASYHNNHIMFTNRQAGNAMKQIIIAYFDYIKEKAKHYANQSPLLLDQQQRLKYMQDSETRYIIQQINRCFKIQNCISVTSQKYQLGNKTPQLIQFIFSCLLKTYLFCYSIVSLGIKTLLKHLKTLSINDLQQFSKLIKYYNKDYSRNFLVFLQQNKQINSFKDFKYNEIIKIDQKTLQIIEYQIQIISKSQNSINIKSIKGVSDLIVSLKQQTSLDINVSKKHRRRKKFDCDTNVQKNYELRGNFDDYQNFYCQSFFFGNQKVKMKGKRLMINRSDSLYTDVTPQKFLSQIDNQKPFKFDQQKWKAWQEYNQKTQQKTQL